VTYLKILPLHMYKGAEKNYKQLTVFRFSSALLHVKQKNKTQIMATVLTILPHINQY
jgi:hypothetical protein